MAKPKGMKKKEEKMVVQFMASTQVEPMNWVDRAP